MAANPEALTNITRECTINVPGIKTVQIFDSSESDCIPPAVSGQITQNISLISGGALYTWEVSDDSADFAETRLSDQNHGDYFDQKFKLNVPKDSQTLTFIHDATRNREFSIVYTDRNGIKKLLPRMQLKSSLKINSGRNAYSFEFERLSPSPAYIFTGTIS